MVTLYRLSADIRQPCVVSFPSARGLGGPCGRAATDVLALAALVVATPEERERDRVEEREPEHDAPQQRAASVCALLWCACGYAVAYTLYWTMVISQTRRLVFYSLLFISLYASLSFMSAMATLIFIVPAVFSLAKALCHALMLVNGCKLYSQLADGAPQPPAGGWQQLREA